MPAEDDAPRRPESWPCPRDSCIALCIRGTSLFPSSNRLELLIITFPAFFLSSAQLRSARPTMAATGLVTIQPLLLNYPHIWRRYQTVASLASLASLIKWVRQRAGPSISPKPSPRDLRRACAPLYSAFSRNGHTPPFQHVENSFIISSHLNPQVASLSKSGERLRGRGDELARHHQRHVLQC